MTQSADYEALRANVLALLDENERLRAEVEQLSHEVMRHQVGESYEVGHEHGVQAGIQHAGGCQHQPPRRIARVIAVTADGAETDLTAEYGETDV